MKAIKLNLENLGPYKTFFYSFKLAKENMKNSPPLAKAMKYHDVVNQLNIFAKLLHQAD